MQLSDGEVRLSADRGRIARGRRAPEVHVVVRVCYQRHFEKIVGGVLTMLLPVWRISIRRFPPV